MIVSCLCPTYNRAPHYLHLLEEAVESFRRQDRPAESELVILNDCPGQTLVCHEPDVRVINLGVRIPSLGEKFNLLVELARGCILLPWEDDDISLSGRINQACARVGGDDYWKPPQVWYMDQRGLHWKHNVGIRHHASAFTRRAWESVGGYPRVSGNQDALMDRKLMRMRHGIDDFPAGIPPSQWQYIYRWGVSPNHLSGSSDHEAAWRAEASKPIATGTFEIKPRWREDYEELTRKCLDTKI